MITGEPGSGKELVARAIHEKSPRANGPFVPVKCAAIAEDLLEAELFGMVREGGPSRQGRFEVANGGTVFLDEISKLSPRIQAGLARLFAEGVIAPVGANRLIPVNVRVVCASVHAIENLVRSGTFREDLYYKLAGCSVYIPPLRERREDIPLMVDYFIEKYNQAKGKNIFGVSPDAMTALLQHDWSHNIRELENLIERIVVLKNAGSIEVCDLPPRLRNFVTDNIDNFYERTHGANRDAVRGGGNAQPQRASGNSFHTSTPANSSIDRDSVSTPKVTPTMPSNNSYVREPQNSGYITPQPRIPTYEEASDIDQFIKKDIDLGNGIDFYRVVEEFENRLIAEALRRTNHNKNRAAQLLSMNRTTLVEKLKKRTTSSSSKTEPHRVKRNSAYTIFDSLGNEDGVFSNMEFLSKEDTDGIYDID